MEKKDLLKLDKNYLTIATTGPQSTGKSKQTFK